MEHYKYWVLVYLWFIVQLINGWNENILYISNKRDKCLTNIFWIISSLPTQHRQQHSVFVTCECMLLAVMLTQSPQSTIYSLPGMYRDNWKVMHICAMTKNCAISFVIYKHEMELLMYYVIFWKFKMLLFLLTLAIGDFV